MNVGDGPRFTAAQLSQLRHQLGNSINHILGFSEVLAEETEEAGQHQLVADLQNISETAYRLIAIISERLVPEKFSGAQAEGNLLLFETVQLVENIRSRIGVLEKNASEGGLTDVLADLVNIGRSASQLQRDLEDGLSGGPYPFELPERQEPAENSPSKASQEPARKLADNVSAESEPDEAARILVVDDDETNLALMARLLRSQQHEVITVRSGNDALRTLAGSEFDLVLLDVMMPEMDGYQVLEELNSRKLKDNLPVIVLSAISDQESAVRCIKLGAEDYLTKPVDMVLLRTKVISSLERKRLRDREISHRRQVENINQELERRVETRVAELTESNVKLQKVETQLQNQIREMELVDQVSRIITSTLDIGQVYQEFTQELQRLVPFDRVAINLVDLAQGFFSQNYVVGEAPPVISQGTWRPLADTQTGETVACGHTLVRADLR